MTSRARARERSLLGATVFTGVLVLFAHAGGPTSCTAAGRRVRYVNELSERLHAEVADVVPGLVLSRGGDTERLALGTVIEINGDSDREVAVLGFRMADRKLYVTPDGSGISIVQMSQITSITVVGGSRVAAGAGNGVLIGGLAGATIGVGLGVNAAPNSEYTAECAMNYGTAGALLGGAVGTGAGAGIGAVSGRARKEYVIGPYPDWTIGSGGTP